ncbi:MAG: hypothetical protein MOIL_01744 [Candidatus Methanolliviera sp. GoM_oil]|nr:MAG: hypothetical protein MOIL_01744 [Candidatus Methanolliviera sp. GoM_oil]
MAKKNWYVCKVKLTFSDQYFPRQYADIEKARVGTKKELARTICGGCSALAKTATTTCRKATNAEINAEIKRLG